MITVAALHTLNSEEPRGDDNLVLFIALGVVCALLFGVCVYFFVLQPRRRRVPLRQAVDLLLRSDERADLKQAEHWLSQAVAAGLRRRDLAEARFALGFARAQLGRYDEGKYAAAATSVAELKAAHGHDAASAYLDLWLQSRLGRHAEVIDLHERHRDLLKGQLQAAYIASASYLYEADRHWRHGDVDAALRCFDQVCELGELAEHVPGNVEDLQIVRGVQAVFDDDLDDAVRSFTAARERAQVRNESTSAAELGLVACAWKSGPDQISQLDGTIGGIVDELELRTLAPDTDSPPNEELVLLFTHAALLHAVSLLSTWLDSLRAEKGLPPSEHDRLHDRVDRLRRVDPELGDAVLIQGLVDYYFAADDLARERAVDLLEKGTDTSKGITLPEVIDLIKRERRIAEEGEDRLTRYLTVVGDYLSSHGVPVQVQRDLLDRLGRFARRPELGEIDLDAEERARTPSIDDVRRRGELLGEKLRQIVDPRGIGRAKDLLGALQQASTTFSKGADVLQKAEHALIVGTGEFLFAEEPQQQSRKEGATRDGEKTT